VVEVQSRDDVRSGGVFGVKVNNRRQYLSYPIRKALLDSISLHQQDTCTSGKEEKH
jgi:hypothetical protein